MMGAPSVSATASSSSPAERAAPGEDCDFSAFVQKRGRLAQALLRWQARVFGPHGRCIAVARLAALGGPLLFERHGLQVRRESQMRDPALTQRGAAGEIRQILDVRGPHDARVEDRDVA